MVDTLKEVQRKKSDIFEATKGALLKMFMRR